MDIGYQLISIGGDGSNVRIHSLERAGRAGGCIANPGTTGGPPPMVRERGRSDPPSASPAPSPGAPSTEQMPRR